MNSFLQGDIPLWAPEMNAGQPLWPVTELWQNTEPLIWAVWGLASLWKQDSQIAASWCGFIWIYLFSFGGMLFSRKLWRHWPAQLLVFGILLIGPISLALPMQTQFLLPFRYFPFLLLMLLRIEKNPTPQNSILFGILLCISSLGYQSIYPLFLLALFTGIYTLTTWRETKVFPFPFFKSAVLGSLLLIPFSLPTLATYPQWRSLIPMVDRSTAYRFPSDYFWPGLIDIFHHVENWHGNSYLGIIPLLFLVFALGSWLFRHKFPPLENTVLIFTLLLVPICISPELSQLLRKMTLDARNWGFCFGVCYLFLLLSSTIGYRILAEKLRLSSGSPFHILMMGVALFDMYALSKTTFDHHPFRIPRLPSVPGIGTRATTFFPIREREFDVKKHYPFHTEGPTFWGVPSATIPPSLYSGRIINPFTHNFQLPRFHDLLKGEITAPILGSVLGVTSPILRIVPYGIPVANSSRAIEALAQMRDPQLLDVAAVIEGEFAIGRQYPTSTAPTQVPPYQVKVIEYHANEIKLETSSSSDGFLIYSDGYTPDWRAYLDGKKTELLVANAAMKAISLPRGTHQIRFTYRPLVYLAAFRLRIAMMIGFALFLFQLAMHHTLSLFSKVPKMKMRSAPLSLCLLVCSSLGFGSSCTPPTAQEQIQSAKHIFVGEVTSLKVPEPRSVLLTLQIKQSFKGQKSGKMTARYTDKFGPKDLSHGFPLGEESIVFIYDEGGKLTLGGCGPSLYPSTSEKGREALKLLAK